MSSVDKIAVVYARYSSHGQTEQSIEGQIAAAQKYAEQYGYTIIHIYADRAMTGRNDDREEFQRMLSDTATHQFGVILLWKIDRFGRNREEIAFNRYRCKRMGSGWSALQRMCQTAQRALFWIPCLRAWQNTTRFNWRRMCAGASARVPRNPKPWAAARLSGTMSIPTQNDMRLTPKPPRL